MSNKKYLSLLVLTGFVSALAIAGPAFAESNTGNMMSARSGNWQAQNSMKQRAPEIFGTVSTVNGTIVTVTGKIGPNSAAGATATTYTVDASKATVTKGSVDSTMSAIAIGDTVMVQGTINGSNVTATAIRDGVGMMGRGIGKNPSVFGTVSAINGTTLTVAGKTGQNDDQTGTSATATTYTVNASNATVTKNNAASSFSAIAIGDTVMVQGTVSGSNITATMIRDEVRGRMIDVEGNEGKSGKPGAAGQITPSIQGNGQPVIGGNITAINGNTLTVTNKSNVTYTVDATSAKITKTGITTATLANISVGDNVIVQGTVNGNSVTASSVIDNGIAANGTGASATSTNSKLQSHMGFFGSIGNFFAHMFGF